jgi:hypothetical protein
VISQEGFRAGHPDADIGGLGLLFVAVMLVTLEGQIFGRVFVHVFEFLQKGLVGEVEGLGVLPVMADDLIDAPGNVFVLDLDGQLAAGVEAAGGEIDGADDGAVSIGEEELGVELNVLQLVDPDANVLENAEAADALAELCFL